MKDEIPNATCLCGAVTVHLPVQTGRGFYCRCSKCRRLSGTGHAAWIALSTEGMIVEGKTAEWTYVADSGASVTRRFCADCGVTVFGTTTASATIAIFPASAVGDAIAFVPQGVGHTAGAPHWGATELG